MIYVAIGGAIGAVLRYLLGFILMKRFTNPPIPVAMVIVNLIGSFTLGAVLALSFDSKIIPPVHQLLVIGFLGAFTTFSTFSMEAIELFQKKQYRKMLSYISITIFGSIGFFSIGYLLLN
ncbi:camphor resistance protein CrcB [Litchfieldia salsa]|uniref:Fluoride-specific ion channel FluC n=2 Tax=Litchfieldia salsa TaxID=930152 RepID=A0A1H0V7E7_9BACI|nr:camphor resistance protein CrcB [Litchfieldia salsa]